MYKELLEKYAKKVIHGYMTGKLTAKAMGLTAAEVLSLNRDRKRESKETPYLKNYDLHAYICHLIIENDLEFVLDVVQKGYHAKTESGESFIPDLKAVGTNSSLCMLLFYMAHSYSDDRDAKGTKEYLKAVDILFLAFRSHIVMDIEKKKVNEKDK